MKIKRLRKWVFTKDELDWLAEQALFSELAADIVVRWNRKHPRFR